MIQNILFGLWFLLPAATANTAPVLSNVIPGLNRWNARIDGGRTWRGKELLGAHKTWRGLLSGMVVSTFVFALQLYAVHHTGWAQQLVDHTSYAQLPLILGPLLGFGALGGDAIESFFKRQKGIQSGGSWLPFDQLDYIIGAVLVTLPFIILTLTQYVWIFVLWFCLHIAATCIGWLLGLKKDPI